MCPYTENCIICDKYYGPIFVLQNKLLKSFSNQLLLKHQCLKQLEDEEEYAATPLERVRVELDQLISLEQFLNVTGLEAKSTKVKNYININWSISHPPPLPPPPLYFEQPTLL